MPIRRRSRINRSSTWHRLTAVLVSALLVFTQSPGLTLAIQQDPGTTAENPAVQVPADEVTSSTVSFSPNSKKVEGTMQPIELHLDGSRVSLPSCSFTWAGHSFRGWALSADGEAVLSDGEEIVDFHYSHMAEDGEQVEGLLPAIDGQVTLYAVWEEEKDDSDGTSNGTETGPDDVLADEVSAAISYAEKDGDVDSVTLHGDAAIERATAIETMTGKLELTEGKAAAIADDLLAVKKNNEIMLRGEDPDEGEPVPRQGDGSNIEYVSAKWITEDTVDNEDEGFLSPERRHPLLYSPAGQLRLVGRA